LLEYKFITFQEGMKDLKWQGKKDYQPNAKTLADILAFYYIPTGKEGGTLLTLNRMFPLINRLTTLTSSTKSATPWVLLALVLSPYGKSP
jgi:hypothetical protein